MRVLDYSDLSTKKGIKYSKPHLHKLEQRGEFPMHIKLGDARNAWDESEIDEWIEKRKAERPIPAMAREGDEERDDIAERRKARKGRLQRKKNRSADTGKVQS